MEITFTEPTFSPPIIEPAPVEEEEPAIPVEEPLVIVEEPIAPVIEPLEPVVPVAPLDLKPTIKIPHLGSYGLINGWLVKY
jgi:hypothetical protein